MRKKERAGRGRNRRRGSARAQSVCANVCFPPVILENEMAFRSRFSLSHRPRRYRFSPLRSASNFRSRLSFLCAGREDVALVASATGKKRQEQEEGGERERERH